MITDIELKEVVKTCYEGCEEQTSDMIFNPITERELECFYLGQYYAYWHIYCLIDQGNP
jgi:hypothetical protein